MVAVLSVPVSQGFTQIPNSVLLDTNLSKNARFLYSVLMQHGRASSGFTVYPSYARICHIMDVSEPTARRAMNELRFAGLVAQERRGQGKSNLYHLHARPKESFVQERKERGVKENKEKEHRQADFESSTAPQPNDFSSDAGRIEEDSAIAPPVALSPPPAPKLDPARLAIFPYIKDIARETHDEAKITASTSRAVNLFHRSNVSMDEFQDHLMVARQRTQERSAAIKRTRDDGVKLKTPYFFAILEDSLGLRQSSHHTDQSYPTSFAEPSFSRQQQEIWGDHRSDLGKNRLQRE